MGGFSSERRRVPVEDAHMKRYIEEELARRQGRASDGADGDEDQDYVESEEARRQRETQEKEENMRGAMLSGIPEVDLGIECVPRVS
jgi:hypothetical protein